MSEVLDIYESSPKAEELLKAYKNGKLGDVKIGEPKSAIIDPYNVDITMGTKAKPTPIPYNTLRHMADVPAVAAIINTRLNQVARFARRPRFEGDMGFKIVLKDSKAKMTEAQEKRAFEIEEFLLTTGAIPNAKRKDNFDKFLRKVVRDTLTLDAMVWENVPNIKGILAEIWAVDAATIEIVVNSPIGEMNELPVYEPVTHRGQADAGSIAYVQKVDGQIIAEYTEDELCYAIRNPRTDIYTVDFGKSELETLIEIVTGILNSVRYNTSYFSSSHLPQGVLEVIGKYDDETMDGFKRHWKAMTSGAAGKWAVPVFGMEEGQGFKFTPFKNSNRDMEFNEFLEFLFNIACAVYQIDPNEVGFKSWTSGNSMTASDNTEAKIDQSQDKGFIPLMQFLANTINSETIDRIDSDFALAWVGIDDEDEKAKLDRDKANVDMGKVTIAELRDRDDMEPILGEDGKPALWTQAPANATLMQVFMAELNNKMQQESQEQQQAQQNIQQAQQGAQDQMSAEDAHKRQLEVMDKQHAQNMEVQGLQHKQNMEGKQADQKHQTNLEAMKQKALKDKQGPSKKDDKLKKSMNEEDLEITVTWDNY